MALDQLQFIIFIIALTAMAYPLGLYMARVFKGERTWLTPVVAPIERGLLRLAGVKVDEGQRWTGYALSMLLFNTLGFVFLYSLLRVQNILPLNPQGFGPVAPDLSFNTAVSFITNTNWQSYGGETTLSHLTQMLGLTVQNFLSAATGIVIAVAVTRGIISRSGSSLGNFWVDLTRCVLYILLPVSIVFALFLVAQGIPQTLTGSVTATTLEGVPQVISQGPVASQVAIKMFGTNGGGFFNVNAAHPFENPTILSNFMQILSLLLIGAALPFFFGKMVGDQRQGIAIFAAMTVLFVIMLGCGYAAEHVGNPLIADVTNPSAISMEGKETRFGVAQSVLFTVATTVASCGAVNNMHDSLTPLGGMVPLINMLFGEVIYGGVGAGFYGIMLMVILTVFLAGLMVGRTPEYLGKKIEAREVKLAALTLLVMPIGILMMSALAIVSGSAQSSTANTGPHGLSELIYAYTSATANNGSAFGGFSANTIWHNTFMGISMMLGRFGYIIPILAIAGSLAGKKITPASSGTFPTHGGTFVMLLIAVIVIVGALTFLPALALGPIAEQVSMINGKTF